jgi:hypothetical protein
MSLIIATYPIFKIVFVIPTLLMILIIGFLLEQAVIFNYCSAVFIESIFNPLFDFIFYSSLSLTILIAIHWIFLEIKQERKHSKSF